MTELFVSLVMCAWFAGNPQMNPGKDKVHNLKIAPDKLNQKMALASTLL